MSLAFECRGEVLVLLPEKALFWPAQSTLFVADLHLGKAATFRAFGAPVPETATFETLQRLTDLVGSITPKRIVILGDLFHAKEATTGAPIEAFRQWRDDHSHIDLKLIVGNHDRKAFAEGDRKDWMDAIDEPPFRFAHHPVQEELYVLSGHLHPGFRLRAPGHPTQSLPCFWFSEHFAVLPAFGSFTGLSIVKTRPGDRVFLATGKRVLALRPC